MPIGLRLLDGHAVHRLETGTNRRGRLAGLGAVELGEKELRSIPLDEVERERAGLGVRGGLRVGAEGFRAEHVWDGNQPPRPTERAREIVKGRPVPARREVGRDRVHLERHRQTLAQEVGGCSDLARDVDVNDFVIVARVECMHRQRLGLRETAAPPGDGPHLGVIDVLVVAKLSRERHTEPGGSPCVILLLPVRVARGDRVPTRITKGDRFRIEPLGQSTRDVARRYGIGAAATGQSTRQSDGGQPDPRKHGSRPLTPH